jgi:hypothetical protein
MWASSIRVKSVGIQVTTGFPHIDLNGVQSLMCLRIHSRTSYQILQPQTGYTIFQQLNVVHMKTPLPTSDQPGTFQHKGVRAAGVSRSIRDHLARPPLTLQPEAIRSGLGTYFINKL